MNKHMNDRELRELIQTTVDKTVQQTLISLGVDHNHPLEMQKDFKHLREWRLTLVVVRGRVITTFLTALTIAVSGWLAAIYLGMKGE